MGEGTVPGEAHGEAPGGVPAGGPLASPTGGWAAPGGNPGTPAEPGPVPASAVPGYGVPGYGVPGYAVPGYGGAGYGGATTAHPVQAPGPPGQPGPSWQPAWGAALHAHKPGIIALRPLGLGDIIEASFACLRRSPRTFLGLSLLTGLAVLVVSGLALLAGYLVATGLEGSDTVDLFLAFGLTSTVAVLVFLSSATSIALSGILAYPVAEAVLGRNASMGETWRRTRRAIPRLVGLCLVLVVPPSIVFAAVIALTVWGFTGDAPAAGALGVVAVLCLVGVVMWLGIRLCLATPALVLEDLGVMASLRRSWRLTPGLFWRTLGILLVSTLLISIVQSVLSLVVQFGGALLGVAIGSMFSGDVSEVVLGIVVLVVSLAGGLLSGIITQPFLAAVLALLYTDARIRKEGFDLALARAVATAGRSAR